MPVESYRYIEPFPLNAPSLQYLGLRGLEREWREERARIEKAGKLAPYLTRVRREWAIETGLIERLYYWDRGVTELLIEQGIDAAIIAHRTPVERAKADSIKAMIEDHEMVLEGLFGLVGGVTRLSEHAIRTLHQVLTRGQETTLVQDVEGNRFEVRLERGVYKSHPNNPKRPDGTSHTYCPPEFVGDEMARLVEWYGATSGPPEVLAAWLHHRFTQIHPFQDGNGRVARALASMVFIQAGLFPLVIRDADRNRYITALELADNGDLGPLATLFGERQASIITQALDLGDESDATATLERIVASGARALLDRNGIESTQSARIVDLIGVVRQVVQMQLSRVADLLNAGLAQAVAIAGSDPGDERFREAVIASGGAHYNQTTIAFEPAVLEISIEPLFQVDVEIVPVTPLGGVALASAGMRLGRRVGDLKDWESPRSHGNTLRFSYAEETEAVRIRAEQWISEVSISAMELWRRRVSIEAPR